MPKATAKVRMYNQENLGDCFLLQFTSEGKDAWIMIDFGSYQGNNEAREKEIIEDIKGRLNGAPVTIVLTHQHKDHLSGFVTTAEEMQSLTVPELWLSFLDDENSEQGKAVRDVSGKYWNKNDKIKKIVNENFGLSNKKVEDLNTAEKSVADMMKAKEGYDLFAEGQTGGKAIFESYFTDEKIKWKCQVLDTRR
jgi:hypothetical protein